MIRTRKTEGIILKRSNLGEADRILVIYSKHYGKIRAIAKGIRKVTSRKAGSLELFNHTLLFFIKGRNLDLISEAQTINSFKSWRKDLRKICMAYYFCELVDKLTPDEQENRLVFELLKESLDNLEAGGSLRLIRGFEERLLEELGFGVPPVVRKTPGSLKTYIESIIEKRINSPKILKELNG